MQNRRVPDGDRMKKLVRHPPWLTAVTLAALTGLAAAACDGSGGQASQPGAAPSAAVSSAATTQITLQVPSGLGGGAFSSSLTVTLPQGWTAAVWARVPDARMEAWTPQGDLLVSQPDYGTVVELRPPRHS